MKKLIRNFTEGLFIVVPFFIIFLLIKEIFLLIHFKFFLAWVLAIFIFIFGTAFIGSLAESKVKNYFKNKFNALLANFVKEKFNFKKKD